MTRPLQVLLAEPLPVFEALRDALAGSGPAILPHPDPSGAAGTAPATVPRKVAVIVETSGSTGRPKRVALSADALLASAAASDTALGGPGQWMLALPAHYIAGINVLVRAITAEVTPVFLDPAGFTAERFVEACGRFVHPRRLVSLVPTQLARLLDDEAAVEQLRQFAAVLIGGQAMPAPLAERALRAGVNVTRSYGSSETSGGCVYDGRPIGDTRVRIADGRVELAGSVLAEGYLDDPRRTALAFRDEHGDRWYRTDDAGDIVDGVLHVLGRLDDVIVSGGIKVALSAVEETVRGMPGLESSVVIATPHPEWGETPVVVTDTVADLHAVRAVVAARLGKAAAPTGLVRLDRIPMLPSGKPDRLAISALVMGH